MIFCHEYSLSISFMIFIVAYQNKAQWYSMQKLAFFNADKYFMHTYISTSFVYFLFPSLCGFQHTHLFCSSTTSNAQLNLTKYNKIFDGDDGDDDDDGKWAKIKCSVTMRLIIRQNNTKCKYLFKSIVSIKFHKMYLNSLMSDDAISISCDFFLRC